MSQQPRPKTGDQNSTLGMTLRSSFPIGPTVKVHTLESRLCDNCGLTHDVHVTFIVDEVILIDMLIQESVLALNFTKEEKRKILASPEERAKVESWLRLDEVELRRKMRTIMLSKFTTKVTEDEAISAPRRPVGHVQAVCSHCCYSNDGDHGRIAIGRTQNARANADRPREAMTFGGRVRQCAWTCVLGCVGCLT